MKEILKELVRINTIKDKDNKEIINYIENYLKDLGFTTEYKSKCLVMSNRKDCNIGFLGHTDTVDYSNDWDTNPFELVERDNKLYGLGTCDMKGGIATILSVIPKIKFKNKGIKLIFTYDEELGFSGIKELLDKKIVFPDTMIIGEPTNNEIITSSKGLLDLKVIFKGLTAHASTPEEGINAIDKCIDFINKLKKVMKKYESVTMNVGKITGGRSSNMVPDYCEVALDFRTISKNQNKEIIEKIKSLIKDDSLEIISNINPFKSNDEINISNFLTEASLIDSKNRYILGLNNNAHKKNEFITKESIELLEKQYIELIEKEI